VDAGGVGGGTSCDWVAAIRGAGGIGGKRGRVSKISMV